MVSNISILNLSVSITLVFVASSTIVRATDVHYCEENTEYEVKVKDVDISPNPVARGEPATFTISANTGSGISSGNLVIEVSYFGWYIHSETSDLCAETACPVKTGDFLVAHSQLLPGYTPPGSYSLQMKMLDAHKKELTCINFTVYIGSGPSMSDI
ncbi:unnamed protein product [Cochlearia groenlandica]